MPLHSQEPIEIMIERKITNGEKYRAGTDRARTQCGGHDAVDPARASICQEANSPRTSRKEGVEVSHRHTVPGKQRGSGRKEVRQFSEDARLREICALLEACL